MPRIQVDGETVEVAEGALVASALGDPPVAGLSLGGAPRGPLCGMGQCFECLVWVDGRQVLACLTPAVEGLAVRRG
jgi:sarcosine oxidase subunit alpha